MLFKILQYHIFSLRNTLVLDILRVLTGARCLLFSPLLLSFPLLFSANDLARLRCGCAQHVLIYICHRQCKGSLPISSGSSSSNGSVWPSLASRLEEKGLGLTQGSAGIGPFTRLSSSMWSSSRVRPDHHHAVKLSSHTTAAP